MGKLTMTVKLTYDDENTHSGDNDKKAKEWFFEDILKNDKLFLWSREMGDEIGEIDVLDIKEE